MKYVLTMLFAGWTTCTLVAGELEDRWAKQHRDFLSGWNSPQAKQSDFANKEFQAKSSSLEGKKYSFSKESSFNGKSFNTMTFNPGSGNTSYFDKKFEGGRDSYFKGESSLFSRDKGNPFSDKASSMDRKEWTDYDRTARENGEKAILEREKSVLADMRYQGPEVKKISGEMEIINDTLKKKEDLKDHKLSLGEIKDILNKN